MITLDRLRQQCRLDSDDTREDTQLTFYAQAARKAVENHINRPLFDEAVPEEASEGLVITEDIELAILMLTAHFFESRVSTSEVKLYRIPQAYEYLLGPYRVVNV